MKHVEAALYECGIPGVVPHRHDNRTIKVPLPRYEVKISESFKLSAGYTGLQLRLGKSFLQLRSGKQKIFVSKFVNTMLLA